jgi:undecaprenyl-diphosphatase
MALRADQRPTRRFLGVAAALVAVNVSMFVLIAEDLLDGGELVAHDQAVLTWIVDHRTGWMISAARAISALGGFAGLAVIGAITALVLWRRGWPLVLDVAPMAALLLGSLASTIAKSVFGRPRPPVAVHETHVTLAAFPSGHATESAAFFVAGSLALALTVARSRTGKVLLLMAGLLLTGAVGVSRLVLGVHWLSDVVAGWCLGTAIALVVATIAWELAAGRTRSASGQPFDR